MFVPFDACPSPAQSSADLRAESTLTTAVKDAQRQCESRHGTAKNSWLVAWNDGTWIGATIQNSLNSGL